jgi:uncharacterized protein YkwD
MHSSVLLASALAVGALALPQPNLLKRRVVIEYDVVTVMTTVYVTANAPPPVTRIVTATLSTINPQPTIVYTFPPVSAPRPSAPMVLLPSRRPRPKYFPTSRPASFVYTRPPVALATSRPALPIVPTPSSFYTPSAPSSAAPTLVPVPVTLSDGHISGTSQAYLSSGPEYQRAVLYHHNSARANHNADPLVWDDDCASTAALAANTCQFEHYIPTGAGQGQNLFTVSGSAFNITAGITESWYKGELPPMLPYFGQKDIPEDVFHSVGHLTQMVWKGTTKVGCVSIDCGSSMVVGGTTSTMNKYTVCNYAPAGNIAGRYALNVGAPVGTDASALGSWSD